MKDFQVSEYKNQNVKTNADSQYLARTTKNKQTKIIKSTNREKL